MKKTIAIVSGEPKSINVEIIAKSWVKRKNKKINLFVIGNFLLLKRQLKKNQLNIPIKKVHSIKDIIFNNYLNILEIPLKFKNPYKINKKENSKYILKSINLAHKLALNKEINGFINCPVDKDILFGSKNIGMTEYLAKKNKLKNSEVMMIYNKNLAVVPLTTHIPIKSVSKKLNANLIQKKIVSLNKNYYKLFKKKPLIAILGLNPHNSEFRKNSEEIKIIIPSIKKLRKMKCKVIGPISSDTAFIKKNKYDVIVGMYHDQVLTPFKTIYNFDAINVTLGLNYIRVSPDHGTADNIIGLKKANPSSLINAIDFFSKI